MRLFHLLWLSLLTPAVGCNAEFLRNRTLDQLATVADLRSQQVLDNLANIAADPGSMPSFAVLEKGTTQIADTTNPSGSLTWDPRGLTAEMLGVSLSRQLTGEWDVSPVTDPDKIHAMRCVYYWALGMSDSCDNCAESLRFFKVDHQLERIQPGWLNIGKKHDVPKHACRSSHCGDTYVWVNSGGLDGLTRLTMVIMDIATVDKSTLSATHATKTVYQFDYVPGTNNISKVTMQQSQADSGAPAGIEMKARDQRLFFSSSGIAVTPPAPPALIK